MKIEITTEKTAEGVWLATACEMSTSILGSRCDRVIRKALSSHLIEGAAVVEAVRLLFTHVRSA